MKKYISLSILAILFIACNDKSTTNNSFEKLSKTQSSIAHSFKTIDSLWNQGVVNVDQFDRFISEALAFYEKYPEESLSPDMLNNAANLSLTLANYYKQLDNDESPSNMAKYANQAITLYDLIIKVYPDYKHLSAVYLNKAILYDDILGDKASAEQEYREYLHKFPNDPANESFGDYLQNDLIGKSAEEIYDSFKK
ncbi:MAG: hypothetical protein LBV02_03885 [Bacteroidales bacterium]|jgi:tetratricopeptide (TPR) repeat protein|nr:hypothetical protein [Bacteroidales bacterium]